MILGQSDQRQWYEKSWYERGDFILALGPIGGLAAAAANTIDSIKNAITGGGVPQIEAPESPASVGSDAVSTGKATARSPEATASDDEGYYYPSQGGASVWPWLLGIGLIGGGVYLYQRSKKRGKR